MILADKISVEPAEGKNSLPNDNFRSVFYPLWLSFIWLLLQGCIQDGYRLVKIEGEAQGTSYHISYYSSSDEPRLKRSIDSILDEIDLSVSTYNPNSLLSKINRNDTAVLADRHIQILYQKSNEISEMTGGLFDVTVGALVDAWGFSRKKFREIDQVTIDSLLQYTGYKKIRLQNGKLVKTTPEIQLDFNAIAQGYTVDQLAGFLESKGIRNFLVELGGEVMVKGEKPGGEQWKIGIDKPDTLRQGNRAIFGMMKLRNRALATSGSYRNYYIRNGKKYPHIINPVTGFPVTHQLLSATVTAPDCMTADAFATAFMVMGLENSKLFLDDHPDLNLEGYFIYGSGTGLRSFHTGALKNDLEEVH